MRCIIVDDEPIAREGIEKLVEQIPPLVLLKTFNNAKSAAAFMQEKEVDLVFLDIQMPGTNGLEFARSIPKHTLIIFTTAYSEYALDSYEVDAIDYLVKPINPIKFKKAVDKAIHYHSLLLEEEKKNIENIEEDHIYVKSDRRFFRVNLKDILFIESLKDYAIIHLEGQEVITRMTIKNIHELLPKNIFLRINRSFIINRSKIDSFSNNDVFIGKHEIAIGNLYREDFFQTIMGK
ncbi:MAG: LytTR family DNA-binding domain-containing protein [Bacteroides sp.]|nr:LytTR family DNA-binding domain-containing protein [Bacteroides sp.]